MTQRSVLIVSLNFPPSQIASVHRARHLAKHLPAYGWLPIVVTVDERYHKEPADPALGELVPPGVEVHRVAALPLSWTSALGLGDLALRSLLAVRRKIQTLRRIRKIDAAFITGWPFYEMLLSGELRKAGVPVVLDFQDPWVSAWGAGQPRWSKAGLTHRLATILEPHAVRAASYITSVSEVQNQEMAARYPWLNAAQMAAVPIGGDPEDFAYLRHRQITGASRFLTLRKFNISFVGTFMPRSGPLVRLVLEALKTLRRDRPQVADAIMLNFIGTSNQPGDAESYRVMPLAHEVGVASHVREVPQRVPYLDALSILAHTQAVLLVGSDEAHYTASKIYPALMSGRPIISFFHESSSSYAILAAAGGGVAHAYRADRAEVDMVQDLAAGLRRIVEDPGQLGSVNKAAYADYEARAIAARYAEIFESVRAND